MCGIAGMIDFDGAPIAAPDLQAMCAAIVHRGPDDGGQYISGGVGLGMRRLSIIDLHTGHQPVHNEDKSVWVVFNGEIYNFRELRAELEQKGHTFYTETDTEVIVHLYEQYGAHCVDRMRGMFAFALWDHKRRTALLARDRLGKKPLYYGWIGRRLVFASELKSILQLEQVEPKLNWNAVSHLFTFLSTPASESIIDGIHKLEPAHLLLVRPEGEAVPERYWRCEFNPDYAKSEDYFVQRLRELLEESVRMRLVSDVPLGAFLSGGIDSSAVVAMMSRLSPGQVKTFSIGFNEADYNELHYARMVADRFGTEHHELTLEPDIFDNLDQLAWYLDEPFGDSSAIPTYMVSKIAAEHVTVLLSGDGGDEVFAGYEKYVPETTGERDTLRPYARSAIRALGSLIPDGVRGRNFVRHMALFGPERYLDSATLFRTDEKRRLFQPEAYRMIEKYDPWQRSLSLLSQSDKPWLSTLQLLDLNSYLPLDILAKVDRMSMANSVEARAPLLDHKLVEFAATIPPEMQLKEGVTKYIFKKSMRGILPDAIIDRRKHGFAVPLGTWFQGKLASYARELLLSETATRRGIFNPGYVSRLLKRQQKGRELDLHLWTLISFELWCRTFLDRQTAGSPNVRDRARTEAMTYCHTEA